MKASVYRVVSKCESLAGEVREVVETVVVFPSKGHIPELGESRHFGAMDYRAALHGSVVRVERVSGRELRGSR